MINGIPDDDQCAPEASDDGETQNSFDESFLPDDLSSLTDANESLHQTINQTSSKDISFTGQRDDEMLQDGFLSPTEIHCLVEDMRRDFGLRDLDVSEIPFFQNAARQPGENSLFSFDDHILYDSDFLRENAVAHGSDIVTGIIAHEVGHTLIKPDVSSHDHELAADLIAGMVSARSGCATEAMTSFYLSPEVLRESDSHPHGLLRLEKFLEGYELAKNNLETALGELLTSTSVVDSINYTNLSFDNILHAFEHRSDATGAGADSVSISATKTGPKKPV